MAHRQRLAGACAQALAAVKASAAAAVSAARHGVPHGMLPCAAAARHARTFCLGSASRQAHTLALLASSSARPRQLMKTTLPEQQKWYAARQRALSSGRGVWGFFDAVQGKKMIGKDQHGNTYWEVANPGGNPNPKREIDYFEKNMVRAPAPCASC